MNNNARGTFSAPSFKEAKISLKDNKSIKITSEVHVFGDWNGETI